MDAPAEAEELSNSKARLTTPSLSRKSFKPFATNVLTVTRQRRS